MVALTLLSGAAPSTPPPRLAVLVRIDMKAVGNYVKVSDLIDEIRRIWKPYADLDFADIAEPAERGYDDQLRLVIAERSQSDAPNAEALAWIAFSGPGQPLDVITLSMGAASHLLSEGRWGDRRIAQLPQLYQRQFMTHALARSAAHEIGHYLLRSSAHSSDGLMRAHLTVDDMLETNLRLFRLGQAQIDALRRRASVAGLLVDATHGQSDRSRIRGPEVRQ